MKILKIKDIDKIIEEKDYISEDQVIEEILNEYNVDFFIDGEFSKSDVVIIGNIILNVNDKNIQTIPDNIGRYDNHILENFKKIGIKDNKIKTYLINVV
jgi:uncharacterized protein YjcR